MIPKSKSTKKYRVYRIAARFGKPWEERVILLYHTVTPTSYMVSDIWHRQVINFELFHNAIVTYYA